MIQLSRLMAVMICMTICIFARADSYPGAAANGYVKADNGTQIYVSVAASNVGTVTKPVYQGLIAFVWGSQNALAQPTSITFNGTDASVAFTGKLSNGTAVSGLIVIKGGTAPTYAGKISIVANGVPVTPLADLTGKAWTQSTKLPSAVPAQGK